jgi:glycosyltransferase involved in cell wall biosynthesis
MTISPVSVVIPTHNAERFVAEAIDSVLAQSVPTQLIVVDDGSTDTTGAIADAYGSALHCIHQAQRGLAGARNRGLAAARHEWIAFLDADDQWETGKLERQCAVLSAHQDVDMVFGHYVEFASGEDDGEGLIARTDLAPGYSACAMLARRNLFERRRLLGDGEDRRIRRLVRAGIEHGRARHHAGRLGVPPLEHDTNGRR